MFEQEMTWSVYPFSHLPQMPIILEATVNTIQWEKCNVLFNHLKITTQIVHLDERVWWKECGLTLTHWINCPLYRQQKKKPCYIFKQHIENRSQHFALNNFIDMFQLTSR